ncbi:cytochrome c oxidase assembly protein [Sphingomonas sabuli]|uniref:Cytochrome c oxidase assembly protein n=1 Tax=Sphingomonas sabuli TaxID=2764186 RepID=A0A7G9KZS1_9SPHN|nr:cytochrome c oxidase assembly protein [Sphingomonas sabuli]QNM81870.1 cytochrome c oxidase assembly protein [Sphingomonas sabuli]
MPATAPTALDAIAYCGPAVSPGDFLTRWNFDPILLLALGALTLWAARVRSDRPAARQSALLIGLLAFLYISPFCAWGSSLFTVRVVHHLALGLLVAPLVAALARRPLGKVPGGIAVWTVLSAVAMWTWHAPNLYHWAVTHDAGYWLMQGTIAATATLFWHRLDNASRPVAIAALLAAMVAMGALGALITLSQLPLYAAHFASTAAWGMAPLDDQQLGGLVMWAPASAVYLVAALARVRHLATGEAMA